MLAVEKIQRGYTVRTSATEEPGILRVVYVPSGQPLGSGRSKKVHEHSATVNVAAELVIWDELPVDSEAVGADFEADALRRAKVVHDWLTVLATLLGSIERWAKELGWSLRRIEKVMEDSQVGRYTVPVLLLQEETTKLLLEPITRLAPGVEGVADLYLLPGYDDIASLYYREGRWSLHYMWAGKPTVGNIREAESKLLTKASFRKVIEEMKANAQ